MGKESYRKVILWSIIGIIIIAGVIVMISLNKTDPSDGEELAVASPVEEEEQGEVIVYKNVSVHDPSIIKVDDTYYVFGTHIEAAHSTDLQNWTRFTNGYTTPNNRLYGDLSKNLAQSFAWAGENDSDSKGGFSVWAPEIFWNEHYVNDDGTTGAYMMYYSASSTYIRSAIGFAVAQNIEGPYTHVDTLVYSGFTRDEAYDIDSEVNKQWENTNIKALIDEGKMSGEDLNWFHVNGTYANNLYPNAIDANLFFDEDNRLWMTYGSWSGGIFLLELDKETGRAIYPGVDGTTEDGRMIDRYFGIKIAGGHTKSGEGPYVVYHEETGYYFLYVTYAWLGADGGYNMRTFRAISPEGPYVDALGEAAVLPGNVDNSPYGNKLMGNYLFERRAGDPGGGAGIGYVSPGHNSVFYDAESGEQFLVFHTRFPGRGEAHEVRVHQMFMNVHDWPVVAPYRFTGESLEAVSEQDIIGDYKYINHGKDNLAIIKNSAVITLNPDHTISGSVAGTWELSGDYDVTITVNDIAFYGVFVRVWDPTSREWVMSFTAMSETGVSVWGSEIPVRSDADIVKQVMDDVNLGYTEQVVSDLKLPKEGTSNIAINWETSDANVITNEGVITRPAAGADPVTATLTATVTYGEQTASKSFEITVMPHKEASLVAHYTFDGHLRDVTENYGEGTVSGERIDMAGGHVSFADGWLNEAAVFDGSSGIRLPDGLISSNSYAVSVWLNPEELSMFTTTFFGAKDSEHWVSLVPYGPVGDQTMVWSGNLSWYDAPIGHAIPIGQWSHLAFSVHNGLIEVYINGEQKFSGIDFPHIFTGQDTIFGLGVNWWDTPYEGLMDELQIFEGPLSEVEIEQLAQVQ